jgi:hypothetical protein
MGFLARPPHIGRIVSTTGAVTGWRPGDELRAETVVDGQLCRMSRVFSNYGDAERAVAQAWQQQSGQEPLPHSRILYIVPDAYDYEVPWPPGEDADSHLYTESVGLNEPPKGPRATRQWIMWSRHQADLIDTPWLLLRDVPTSVTLSALLEALAWSGHEAEWIGDDGARPRPASALEMVPAYQEHAFEDVSCRRLGWIELTALPHAESERTCECGCGASFFVPPSGRLGRRRFANTRCEIRALLARSVGLDAPLTVELVPASQWGANLAQSLKGKRWDCIRIETYRRAGHRCEICSGIGTRHAVEAHEVWNYDEEVGVQRLVRLVALCPACHEAKHFGRAKRIGREHEALAHLARVNDWTEATARRHATAMLRLWVLRSKISWVLDLGVLVEYGIEAPTAEELERGKVRARARLTASRRADEIQN